MSAYKGGVGRIYSQSRGRGPRKFFWGSAPDPVLFCPSNKKSWRRHWSNLRREESRKFRFLYRNLSLPFIFPSILVAIDSPERFSSKTDPRYVTTECCLISISPLLIFICFRFLYFFHAKRMDLVLSSPKCILSLFSTNQLQRELKFLFKLFSIRSKSVSLKIRQESSAYRSKSQSTAHAMSFT